MAATAAKDKPKIRSANRLEAILLMMTRVWTSLPIYILILSIEIFFSLADSRTDTVRVRKREESNASSHLASSIIEGKKLRGLSELNEFFDPKTTSDKGLNDKKNDVLQETISSKPPLYLITALVQPSFNKK